MLGREGHGSEPCRAELLDHGVAIVLEDDALDVGCVVAGSDREVGRNTPDSLVLLVTERDRLRAARVAALAEEVPAFFRRGNAPGGELRDSFVHVPEERLVASSLDASVLGLSHDTLIFSAWPVGKTGAPMLIPLEESGTLTEYLTAPPRQASTVRTRGHRPWPLPRRPWLMGQSWLNLLFAHWRVSPADLRPHVPKELVLDELDGVCWVGITPFYLSGLSFLCGPPLPFAWRFPELNVRTYVSFGGKPGIYFLSLDAGSRFAVRAARKAYRLPYFDARMQLRVDQGTVSYRSERLEGQGHAARFRAAYSPRGELRPATAEALTAFLAERYCLYTVEAGKVLRAEIHHRPWSVADAEVEIHENTMPPPGLQLAGRPICHFSPRQDTVIWPLKPASER